MRRFVHGEFDGDALLAGYIRGFARLPGKLLKVRQGWLIIIVAPPVVPVATEGCAGHPVWSVGKLLAGWQL